MPTKTDIKKILSKGLTGKQAGKLIFQDNWLVDTRRGGFLSERDMSSLKAGQSLFLISALVGISTASLLG